MIRIQILFVGGFSAPNWRRLFGDLHCRVGPSRFQMRWPTSLGVWKWCPPKQERSTVVISTSPR